MKKILRRIKTFCAGGGVGSRQEALRLTPKVVAIGLFFLVCSPAFALEGKASWYSSKDACKYNPTKGCPTASGKSIYVLEKEKIMFAASWSYPLGTKVRVTNRENSRSIVVEIWDRGPAKRLARVIDLGKEAFSKIAPLKSGVINVSAETLSSL